jgi:hypothetical protein
MPLPLARRRVGRHLAARLDNLSAGLCNLARFRDASSTLAPRRGLMLPQDLNSPIWVLFVQSGAHLAACMSQTFVQCGHGE